MCESGAKKEIKTDNDVIELMENDKLVYELFSSSINLRIKIKGNMDNEYELITLKEKSLDALISQIYHVLRVPIDTPKNNIRIIHQRLSANIRKDSDLQSFVNDDIVEIRLL